MQRAVVVGIEHRRVSGGVVIGVIDAKWGERPMALVVSRPGPPGDASDIKAHVQRSVARGEISRFAVPEMIVFVKQLDKTSVGKHDKKAMRQKYGGARPASVS